MSKLQAAVFECLAAENLKDSDWLELITRLLDYGVVCRDESQVEADLYDRFVRIESTVDDYLALMGVRLYHDSRFQYVRLIPPGARVPGVDDEADTPFNGGLRARLSQHDVALLLTLRAEYDKSLREGQVDENGCVNLSLEALALALKNLLARSLPDSLLERKNVFKRLRQLRVIRFGAEADLLSADSWIKIRPMIVNLVSNELVDSLANELPIADLDDALEAPVMPDASSANDQALNRTSGDSIFDSSDVDVEPSGEGQ